MYDGSGDVFDAANFSLRQSGLTTTIKPSRTRLTRVCLLLIMGGRWKLVTREGPFDESRLELYDLEADPGEARDLKAEDPDVHGRMIELWREERRKLGIILPGDL